MDSRFAVRSFEALRHVVGYSCTCIWAVILLASAVFGIPYAHYAVPVSMFPGLAMCLCSIFLLDRFPPIAGRTPFVMVAGAAVAVGTALYSMPVFADFAVLRFCGLALSGSFAIVVIMAWFESFSRLGPRRVIVASGLAVSVSAVACWGILLLPEVAAACAVSLLPLVSVACLPAAFEVGERPRRSLGRVLSAAVPLRTLVGLAITFFIIRSIATLAPSYEQFGNAVSPVSLVIPFAITAAFIISAVAVKGSIDPSVLYKVLLSVFAGGVFLLASSAGITSSLVFYATIVSEVLMWTVLVLWAKRTPVRPHLVFAIGWVAECLGSTLGQLVAPVLIDYGNAFYWLALMLIILAVGFAFSDGSLVLNVDFRDLSEQGEDGAEPVRGVQDGAPSAAADSPAHPAAAAAASEGSPASEGASDAAGVQVAGCDAMLSFATRYDISPREREVLALWVAGRGMKFIEEELFISESTVKTHLRSIYRKCGTHNRDETISLYQQETERG